ncbi:MAG: DUF1800 domain-containing protein [Acidobacteria bacterium]|nr:DUF1800 domain-containing protein [Acidobacteriota bacterium]
MKHRVHPGRCAAAAIACCIVLPVAAITAPVDSTGHAWVGDLAPLAESDFGYEQAAHLLERAGFGGTPAEIDELVALGLEGAVARLVDYEAIDDSALAPFDESGIWDPGMDPFPPSRAAAVRRARRHGRSLGVDVLPEDSSRPIQPVVDKFFYGLRSNVLETRRLALWWADRMVVTPRPLEEKMTLFWHDHFATSEVKVRDARKMHLQNRTLRRHATADFKSLVLAVMRDPAMLVYLDNRENVKDHPNENFGRELLELFTMGVGNYTEQDIREASRAFTGWTNDVLDYRFDAELHDDGPKTFLGREGNLGGEEVLDIILEQPATGEFIAGKVYRYLVREELDPVLQVELGRRLRESGYELKALLRTLLSSRDFYSPPSVATQIKSPVALFVSTYRKLGVPRAPTVPDMNSLAGRLGQQLLYPPNVAGWAGGRTWITPATLLERGNAMRSVLFPSALEEFGHPDRRMPGIYRQVGERLARGMTITAATKQGDAASNTLADADEEYNTRYGGYRGYVVAYERVKLVPRHVLDVDLRAMVLAAGATDAEGAVDHLLHRFLRVPLTGRGRATLVRHLERELESTGLEAQDPGASEKVEQALRSTLYLVFSSPEYQLG